MSSASESDNQVLEEARDYIEHIERGLSHTRDLSDEVSNQIRRRLNELRHAVEDGEPEPVRRKMKSLQSFIDEHAQLHYKSAFREYVESIGLAVIVALLLRGFVIEAFKIPTGSMIPTLLVGDHLFVNKFIYGVRVPFTQTFLTRFNQPKRGEVVVFTFPSNEAKQYISKQPSSHRECIDRGSLGDEKDFIKRIVAVEGDRIELDDNQLLINGDPIRQKLLHREQTGNFLYPQEVHKREYLGGHDYTIQYTGSDENFGPVRVRDDHVFVMGDNRDNSSDSRCWGQVPVENIKGRAMFIWWSIGPHAYRWDRVGEWID